MQAKTSNGNSESNYVADLDEKLNTTVEIIVPSLNEEAAIGELLRDLNVSCSLLPVSSTVLVIDGGSTDRTVDICRQQDVRVLAQRGRGKGNALREAVESSKSDILVFIDGDGTYSPADLKILLSPLLRGECDMVVGSRAMNKRERGSIPLFNNLGNRFFNSLINFALGSCLTDSLSGYRVLHRRTFEKLMLFSENFEIEVEMTVEAIANGFRISEIPVGYKARRRTAKSKLRPFVDGIKIGKTLLFILTNINPLRSFGLISLVFFLIAIYPTSLVLYEKAVNGDVIHLPSVIFSAFLFLMSAISIVLGLTSELIVRSRKRCETLIRRIIGEE